MPKVKHLKQQTNEWSDEKTLRDLYWSSFKKNDVVIDCGAYKGLFTLQALDQGAKVISVEPITEYYNLIQQSIDLNNNMNKNHKSYNAFVGNEKKHIQVSPCAPHGFYLKWFEKYPEQLLNHMITFCNEQNLSLSKDMITIDEISSKFKKIDCIKIDVEGGELEAIRGGLDTLKKFHPKLIIEDHTDFFDYCKENDTHDKIFDLLNKLNYKVRDEFLLRNFIIAEI